MQIENDLRPIQTTTILLLKKLNCSKSLYIGTLILSRETLQMNLRPEESEVTLFFHQNESLISKITFTKTQN